MVFINPTKKKLYLCSELSKAEYKNWSMGLCWFLVNSWFVDYYDSYV